MKGVKNAFYGQKNKVSFLMNTSLQVDALISFHSKVISLDIRTSFVRIFLSFEW